MPNKIYYIRKKWRHFKYKLAWKLFRDGEMISFLYNPHAADIKLSQISQTKEYTKDIYNFLGDDMVKRAMIEDMMTNICNHLDLETKQCGDMVSCSGKITIAEREV